MERGFDLIERLVQPPVDQFLKCVMLYAPVCAFSRRFVDIYTN